MSIIHTHMGKLTGFNIVKNEYMPNSLDIIVYPLYDKLGYIGATFTDDKEPGGFTAIQLVEMFVQYEVIPNLITFTR